MAIESAMDVSGRIDIEMEEKCALELRSELANSGVDDGLLDGDKPRKPAEREGDEGTRRRSLFPLNPEGADHPMPNVPIYVNYSTKKTIAQGMMDLALLTANASQLRYVLRSPYWDIYHKVNIGLISISIILQVVVGISLIFIGRYDYRDQENRKRPQLINNIVVALVFLITIVNIFIASFGVDDERTTFLRSKVEPLMNLNSVHVNV